MTCGDRGLPGIWEEQMKEGMMSSYPNKPVSSAKHLTYIIYLHCNPCKTRAIDVVYRCEIRSSRK
jgi:hypothetical protein